MTSSPKYSREAFIECEWLFDAQQDQCYGYSSVTQSIRKWAKEKQEAGQGEQAKILELLARATSMRLAPNSINEPFTPIFHDFQVGRRSAIPEDFTLDELSFFEEIQHDVNDLWLKARLADLLWVCKKQKNPDHAKIAISSYIAHPIDPETWHRDIHNCWERAARLAKQVGDFEKLNEIKSRLFAAFCMEYPSSIFMPLWLASQLDRIQIDAEYKEDLAIKLSELGICLKNNGEFYPARSYFELAAKKHQQCRNDQGWLGNLISLAECFEQEADSRSSDSNIAANSFYENAIQAYRRIPTKHRGEYDVESKIKSIRKKISTTGKAALDEMCLVKTPGVDISDEVKASIAHIAGRRSLEEALMCFSGLYSGPDFQKLAASAKKSLQESILSSLVGSIVMSSDGRIVAKIPPANLEAGEDDPANQAVLHRQIQLHFAIEIQLVVEGQILPALRQLLMEHRVTKAILEDACHHSPIVPQDRIRLLSFALWLGFEHDFGNAIHLLCPQLEHIVRIQLKSAGAHTSTIDPKGIENENGLSTLMELPEATEVFGEDLVFEIKSVFADALGFNLRNETAHGLLTDNAASSISAIYAWWMVLRLVIRSIMNGSSFKKPPQSNDE